MAWLGDGLRVRRLGLTTNTRFLTPSPSEILLDLDLVLLVLALALTVTVAVAVVAVSRPPVSVWSQHPRRHSCSTTHKRCRIPDLDFQTVGKVLC